MARNNGGDCYVEIVPTILVSLDGDQALVTHFNFRTATTGHVKAIATVWTTPDDQVFALTPLPQVM